MRHLVLLTLIIGLCAGCAATPSTIPNPTRRPPTQTLEAEASTPEVTPVVETTAAPETTSAAEPEVTAEVTASAESAPAQRLLVALTTATSRQIGLMDTGGAFTPLLDIAANASRVTPCGDQAQSPDGRYFAFFVGGAAGSLYLMDGANQPVLIDDVEYLVCLGSGTFQFAPERPRFAYIDYTASVAVNEYADGTLKIFDAETVSEAARFENVTTFDLTADGALFVSFFTNNRGQADEAAISLWDGAAVREVATLLPTGERCRFTSASVRAAPDEATAALVLGQRCATGNPATQWQFYAIDLNANSATFAAREYQPGAFVPFSRTNNVFFSPDSAYAFFTVPDGVTTSTVTLAAVRLADMTISTPVERQLVTPSVTGGANAFPRLSPDGQWLAAVVTSPDNDNQIVALSLPEPGAPPIAIQAGSRGDLISALEFTGDSQQIVYIAGATEGGDNTLLTLDLALGSERRIMRGHFDDSLALSPDGSTAALLDWQRVDRPREPMYANLVLLDLATSAVTTLFTGADVVSGEVENLRTALPLAWR
jgi:hypothetical protein